jgi:hypothetical protein
VIADEPGLNDEVPERQTNYIDDKMAAPAISHHHMHSFRMRATAFPYVDKLVVQVCPHLCHYLRLTPLPERIADLAIILGG